jgi:hypothetical protein
MPSDLDKPVLKFNDPQAGERARGGRVRIPYPPSYERPRQEQRFGPKFARLREVLDRGQNPLELREDPDALAPERLIVFELQKPLITFANAVEQVPGLVLFGEDDTSLIDDDGDQVEGYYYLAVPDTAALEQLLRLWDLWTRGQPLGAYQPWSKVFECLHDLRRWGPKDRVSDIDAALISDIARGHLAGNIKLEIELVFSPSEEASNAARAAIQEIVRNSGGRTVTSARIQEIAFDALLVEVTAETALAVAQRSPGSLAELPDAFAIRVQSIVNVSVEAEEGQPVSVQQPAPAREPIGALLDAVPLQNHALLAGRLQIDDPLDLESISVGKRRHGTAMASIIIHGDLLRQERAITRPLHVRPLMYAPDPQFEIEKFPDDRILVDDFVSAIRRMKIGEAGDQPTAPTVILVNISLGDRMRPFFGRMSPWARAIDWLSNELGLLFFVSAGNSTDDIITSVADEQSYQNLRGEERTRSTLAAVHNAVRFRSLLSPGEATNAVTVGALHDDNVNAPEKLGNSLDPLPYGPVPAVSSRNGLGFRNGVKPDLLLAGGRCRVSVAPATSPAALKIAGPSRLGGIKVAGPDLDAAGQPTRDGWSNATSASTALAMRGAHLIHDALEQAYPETFPLLNGIDRALVVKALLAHRARIPDEGRLLIESIFGPVEPHLHARRRMNVLRMFGLGVPNVDESVACVANRGTLWGLGQIGANEARVFQLPLPAALSGHYGWRRLTATLAWFTPVIPGRRIYRSVRLTVEESDGDELAIRPTRGQTDRRAAERGTIFHRSWEGAEASEFHAGSQIELRVSRRPDPVAELPDVIPFAIAVSLETDDQIPIYEEIRTRLAIRPRVAVPAAAP